MSDTVKTDLTCLLAIQPTQVKDFRPTCLYRHPYAPELFLRVQSYSFGNRGVHAKFHNPRREDQLTF